MGGSWPCTFLAAAGKLVQVCSALPPTWSERKSSWQKGPLLCGPWAFCCQQGCLEINWNSSLARSCLPIVWMEGHVIPSQTVLKCHELKCVRNGLYLLTPLQAWGVVGQTTSWQLPLLLLLPSRAAHTFVLDHLGTQFLHLQVEWGMEVIISSPFRCSCLFGLSVHWDVCLYLCHSIGWGKTLIFTNLQDAQRWEGSCQFCSSEMNMGAKSTRGEHVCASTRTGCVERFTDETWCCHSSAYKWEIAPVSLSISPPSLLIFILITW